MTDTPGYWSCPLCYSMNDPRTMHCACVGQVTEGMRSLEMTATSGGPRLDTQPSASSAYSTGTSRRPKPAAISMPTDSGESRYFRGSASSSASSTASPPRQPPRGIAMPFTTPTPHPIESTNVPTPPNRQQRTHHHAQASNQATLYPSSAYRAPPSVYGEPILPNTLPRAPRYGELGWIPPELRPQHPNLSQQPWPETSSTLASQRTGYPPCRICGQELTLNHRCEQLSSGSKRSDMNEKEPDQQREIDRLYAQGSRNQMTDEQREEYRMQENIAERNKTARQKELNRANQSRFKAARTEEQKREFRKENREYQKKKRAADKLKREADERERDEANATGDIGEKRAKKGGKKK